ncbi:MAG: hypothetical protein R3213_11095 [Flavobacteriaceae bacterium]|nr:hypothetical protein [Flavobacteriaceae bacterium]
MKPINSIMSLLLGLVIFTSCADGEKNTADDISDTEEVTIDEPNYYENGVLTVVTEAMDFQTADTLKSGWNKIVYKNLSPEVHFVLLDLYPEGKSVENAKEDIAPPFDEGMAYLNEGNVDSAMVAFGKLPEWFPEIKFVGGTGLISPQHTAESMVNLKPGTYVMECYVKMADGTFHLSHGMVKGLTVLEESTNLQPPAADYTISISTAGLNMEGSPSSGKKTFRVNYQDQKTYEHFLGHDVNLVRYENSVKTDSLIPWLNWMNPTGLKTPPPAGFTFLGGVNNMLAGDTGYFEVDLTPGNYLLISEVPDAKKKGLYKEFKVE